jgi:flagellar biosynthesis anti-sigma factor FlgM
MSDQARVFQQARLAALAVPDVHTDRVEALRRQLASGELRPDPARIAQALTAQGVLS